MRPLGVLKRLLDVFLVLSCLFSVLSVGFFGGSWILLGPFLGLSWGALGALLGLLEAFPASTTRHAGILRKTPENTLPCWLDHQKPEIQISGFWWSRPHGSAIFNESRHQFRYVLSGDAFKTNGKQREILKTSTPLASEAIRPGRPQLRRLPRQLRRFLA